MKYIRKFTPGKWKVDYSEVSRGHIYVLEASGVYHCIAHVTGMWNDEYSNEANANARLIAAAPDMYDALVNVLHDVRNREWPDENTLIELLNPIDGEDRELEYH